MAQLVQTLISLFADARESDLERYLAASTDVERRTREWEAKQREALFTWS